MATRTIDLRQVGLPTAPAIGNLAGLTAAQRVHVHQMMRAQDRPIAAGRRVVMNFGLRGAQDHITPETNPASGGTSTHADRDTAYIYSEARVTVTPGHRLRWQAWIVPAGETQYFDTPNYVSDGPYGSITVASSWRCDGVSPVVTYTTSQEVPMPASQLQYAAVPSGAQQLFTSMSRLAGLIYPSEAIADLDVNRKVCAGPTVATITVSLKGGARVVCGVVWEEPWLLSLDDDDEFPAHVYSSGQAPRNAYPYAYPVEGEASGDDRFGARHTVETSRKMPQRLGPIIAHWSAGTDDPTTDDILDVVSFGDGTGDDRFVPRTVTATSYELLQRAGVSRSSSAPAFSTRCGVYGRDFAQSDRWQILPDSGVVRVRCWVLGYGGAGDTLKVQFFATNQSRIVLEATGAGAESGYIWHSVVGWLECGATPEMDGRVWVECLVGSGDSWNIAAVQIEHMPTMDL